MDIDRMNRSQRLVAIMKLLSERPGELLPLSLFTERFGTAKSTISEDLALVREALEADGSGRLRTLPGAAGGVQYWPLPSREEEQETLLELCRLLGDPGRILPGGFVYMTDLITHPIWSARIGAIMARRFIDAAPDVVLTVETKGILLALMVARALGLPMVIARREGRVTEGPSVTRPSRRAITIGMPIARAVISARGIPLVSSVRTTPGDAAWKRAARISPMRALHTGSVMISVI